MPNHIKNNTIRTSMRIFTVFGIIAALASVCYMIYHFIERPKYLELPIRAPMYRQANGDWYDLEYTTHYDSGNTDTFFIWSRKAMVPSLKTDSEMGYDSREQVLNYFDKWLNIHGWSKQDYLLPGPCINETIGDLTFITGKGELVMYTETNTGNTYSTAPVVCLLITDHYFSDKEVDYYYITILTMNPSILTKFFSQ